MTKMNLPDLQAYLSWELREWMEFSKCNTYVACGPLRRSAGCNCDIACGLLGRGFDDIVVVKCYG
jgi:hypothetical protein